VLDYPGLPAEQAMRPGPIPTYLKSANSLGALRSFFDIEWQTLSWVFGFAH
jgi:hypothetical protein